MANRLFLLFSRSPDACRLCSVVRSSQGESLGKGRQNLNNQSENRLASREKNVCHTEVLFIQKSTVSSMFFVPIHPLSKVVLQVIENQHNSNRLVKGELLPPER